MVPPHMRGCSFGRVRGWSVGSIFSIGTAREERSEAGAGDGRRAAGLGLVTHALHVAALRLRRTLRQDILARVEALRDRAAA